jgi:hypothetical protein
MLEASAWVRVDFMVRETKLAKIKYQHIDVVSRPQRYQTHEIFEGFNEVYFLERALK